MEVVVKPPRIDRHLCNACQTEQDFIINEFEVVFNGDWHMPEYRSFSQCPSCGFNYPTILLGAYPDIVGDLAKDLGDGFW